MLPTEIINSIELAQSQLVKDRVKEEVLIKDWEYNQSKLKFLKQYGLDLKKIQALFQKAAEMTQKQIKFHIEGLVSSALAAIWDDPYEFKLEFVNRRGKTEADLWFVKNGFRRRPLGGHGGGIIDVAALALRMAFWSLSKNTRPILILDEPFKNINDPSRSLHKKTAAMLKMMSKKLKLQVIMVSQLKELMDIADKQISIEYVNGKSIVNGG